MIALTSFNKYTSFSFADSNFIPIVYYAPPTFTPHSTLNSRLRQTTVTIRMYKPLVVSSTLCMVYNALGRGMDSNPEDRMMYKNDDAGWYRVCYTR